jgi:NADH-quinone oxidoreductase subunit E
MAGDKHSQDAVAKLYAEWVSAGMKLSVAGFTATTKIMEAATQSLVSSRARPPIAKAQGPEAATSEGEPEAKSATVTSLKIVPLEAGPAEALTAEAVSMAPTPAVVVPLTSTDDLKQISGIGPKLEQMLIRKGLTSFAQIAALGSDGLAKLDADLRLNGRIQRDNWVGQAFKLAGT